MKRTFCRLDDDYRPRDYERSRVVIEKKKSGMNPFLTILLGLGFGWLVLWLLSKWFGKKSDTNPKGRVIVAAGNSTLNNGLPASTQAASLLIDHVQALKVINNGSNVGTKWISLPSAQTKVDLLSNDQPLIIVDTQLPSGTYSKLKFNISKLQLQDSSVSKLVYPASTYELDDPFVVNSDGSVTTILLDTPLADSLRSATDETGQTGSVIYVPIFNVETREKTKVAPGKKLTFVEPGALTFKGLFGTNLNGDVGPNISVPRVMYVITKDGRIVPAQAAPPQKALRAEPTKEQEFNIAPAMIQGRLNCRNL